jgi:ABC-type uncharacterized transport system substrate-binding protein
MLLNGCCGPSWIATSYPARGHRSGDRNRVRQLRPVESRCTCDRADAFFNAKSRLLAELSLRNAVPAIYEYNEFVNAGGLMIYSGNIKESYRWAGLYTGRILEGDKPADLPVQRVTKVQLIVNLKTAKALNVTIPLSLLGRADEAIE